MEKNQESDTNDSTRNLLASCQRKEIEDMAGCMDQRETTIVVPIYVNTYLVSEDHVNTLLDQEGRWSLDILSNWPDHFRNEITNYPRLEGEDTPLWSISKSKS